MFLLLAACEHPSDDTGDPVDTPETTVELTVRAYTPDGFIACDVLLDGVSAGPCDHALTTTPTTHTLAAGGSAEASDDGLPLVHDDAGRAWVAPPLPVDLSFLPPYPYSGEGYSSEDGASWSAVVTLNRYVGGRWSCEEDGGDKLTDAPITVAEGERLLLPPEMWGAFGPREVTVAGDELVYDREELEIYWAPDESTFGIGIYQSGDGGIGLHWSCVRP